MESEYVDFDDVLPYVGEFGTYHWLLFFGLAPASFNLALIYFVQFFITLTPDYWCAVEALKDAGLSAEERRNFSAVIELNSQGEEERSRCKIYDVDYVALMKAGVRTANTSWPSRDCQAWEYNLTTAGNYHSIVSELNWVCDKDWYATLAQSMFFIGAVFGGLLFGWAADRYGRVPAMVATNILAALASLLTALSTSLADFLVYRFLAGMTFDNIFVMMYVLVLEYVGPLRRTLVANLAIALFYMGATVALPWLAVWVANWRLLTALASVPMIVSCIAHWVLPESARWLLSQGRVEETIKILKSIANLNGRIIPPNMVQGLRRTALQELEDTKTKDLSASILDLFKTPRLRRITIAASVLWMLLSIVYDGHARNVANLPMDVFNAFTIASATELPADLLLIATLDRWGRRWLAFGTLVFSGFFSILTLAFPDDPLAVAVLAIIGRFCVNITYNIGLQYAAELLPTVVRAQGVAGVHIAGYVAALLSPVIVYMGSINKFIPLVVLGVAAVTGGCIALLLPETLHRDLPQTLADGEQFGKDQKFCYFPCIAEDKQPTHPLSLGEIGQQPSFIRHRSSLRASLRGETYRSSLIKHRREVIYLPMLD